VRIWVKRAGIDAGERAGLARDERAEPRQLRKQARVLEEEREILKRPRPSSPRGYSGELVADHQ
jgi:hypothetical protein